MFRIFGGNDIRDNRLATALLEPLTLGIYRGIMNDITDIIPSLNSVNIIDLNETSRSAIFNKDRLTKIVGFSGLGIFDVFMPEGESAKTSTEIGVLVGAEYRLEYNHILKSRKDYTTTSIIKLTDNYAEHR